MNKNAIQKFAIWARNELIAQVSQRAYQYGIDESGFGDASANTLNGRLLTAEEKSQRQELIKQIKEKGYTQVMEEVAYAWFNRFIALRFMEVNNYLPSHIRVFSDASGAFKPEILNDVLHLDLPGLDSGKVAEYIESNDTEALYRYLLLTQCNALNRALPVMFERMGGYTEMLLPNNILRQDSVLGHMVSDIPEEDWQDAVQIIGWLYQYYNTELKDDTFAQLKKNVKITKERIPAATQLFTPDWIVRYMVENSLGRLWLEGHPNAELHDGWKYYLDEAEQERSVEAQLAKLREEYKTIKPEEIRVIDPCMGSGHILVYAFDVLMQIYTSAGWDQREAAQSILKNNLFGLDIDDRAAQLAYFAVMMKARQYDRRLFTRGIQPNIYAFAESNSITTAPLHDMGITLSQEEYDTAVKQVLRLLDELRDAKEYGSILTVTPCDWDLLRRFAVPRTEDEGGQQLLGIHGEQIAAPILQKLINIGEVLSQKYDVVVTNPPYMSMSNANTTLSKYVVENFPDCKADMYAVFIQKCSSFVKPDGLFSLITMHSWMFLSSFTALRKKLSLTSEIINMLHLGMHAFSNDVGTIVQTSAFVYRKFCRNANGLYIDLTSMTSPEEKKRAFLISKISSSNCFTAKYDLFKELPGEILAYWASPATALAFSHHGKIENISETRIGMATADNDRFMRLWFEPSLAKASLSATSREYAKEEGKKWFPYAKGGTFRKWYGNMLHFVNWENDGFEIQHFTDEKTGRVRSHNYNLDYIFKPGFTFTAISNDFSCRIMRNALFGSGGSGICAIENKNYWGLLGLLNSKLILYFMRMLSQTMNFEVNQVGSVPFFDAINTMQVTCFVRENVEISQNDWDAYETSWDFKRNPLV